MTKLMITNDLTELEIRTFKKSKQEMKVLTNLKIFRKQKGIIKILVEELKTFLRRL